MSMPHVVCLTSLSFPWLVCLGVVAVQAIPVAPGPLNKAIEKRRARDLKTRPQVRKTFPPESALRSLARSVIKRQLHPLIILPDNTILDGECRWRGLMLENPDFEVDVIVVDRELSESEVCELQMISAMQSTSLSSYEQALAGKMWMDKNPGATAKQLAERIDLDPSMVSRLSSLWKTIPAVVKAAEEGKIGPKAWHQISLLPEAEQAGLLEMYLSGMPVAQIAEITRKARNSNREAETVKVERLVCPLPSGVTLQFKGTGITLASAIEAMAELTKELKAAIAQQLNASTVQKVLKDKSRIHG